MLNINDIVIFTDEQDLSRMGRIDHFYRDQACIAADIHEPEPENFYVRRGDEIRTATDAEQSSYSGNGWYGNPGYSWEQTH